MKLQFVSKWKTGTLAAGSLVAAALLGIATVWFSPLWILGLALGAVGAMVLLKNPKWGIVLMAVALPFERIGAFEAGGVMTIRISQVLGLMTLIAWVAQSLYRRRWEVKRNPIGWLMIFFLLVNVFSLLNAENVDRGLMVFGFLVFTMAMGSLVHQLVLRPSDVHAVVKGILVGFVLVSVFGLFQFFGDLLGLDATITGLREHYTKAVLGFPRIQSTALEPLYFANYLLLPLGILFSWFWSRHRGLPLWGVVGLLVLGGLNFVLTISRGGYIAGGVMAVVISLFYMRQWFDLRKMALGLGLILVLALGTFRLLGSSQQWETFVEHTQNIFFGASYSERMENYEKAWIAFEEHPLLGIGVGGFGPSVATHPYLEPEGGWKIVNNEFLEVLAESGLFGFIFFFGILVALALRSLRAIDSGDDPAMKAILIGLFGAFVGVVVQYQTFSVLFILHIWFLFGLMLAIQRLLLQPRS